MPPQSRGGERPGSPTFSAALNVPPTLGPFLDTLPPPLASPSSYSTVSDQRTPTAPEPHAFAHRSPPASPTHHPGSTSSSSSSSSRASTGPLHGDRDGEGDDNDDDNEHVNNDDDDHD